MQNSEKKFKRPSLRCCVFKVIIFEKIVVNNIYRSWVVVVSSVFKILWTAWFSKIFQEE